MIFGRTIVRIHSTDQDLLGQIDDYLTITTSSDSDGLTAIIERIDDAHFDDVRSYKHDSLAYTFRSPDMNYEYLAPSKRIRVELPESLASRSHFRGKPLRSMWSVLSESVGILLVHSAVVEKNGRAIVLAGDSGRGKSTLAIDLARNGWGIVGDDYVPMTIESGRLIAHPFFRSVSSFDALRETGSFWYDNDRGKRIYRMLDLEGGLETTSSPVEVEALILISSRTSFPRLDRCSRLDFLRGVIPSSYVMDSVRRRSLMARLGEMTRCAETWVFTPGPRLAENREHIQQWWNSRS